MVQVNTKTIAMNMKRILSTIATRWKSSMPLFFKWVLGISGGIATVALAIQVALNSAGAAAPEWWNTVYPYLIGIGAGMSATAKLTQQK